MSRRRAAIALSLSAGLIAVFAAVHAPAQDDKILNLYTARHYDTDEALYANFTKATGIKVNRIEGGEDALFERIKAEGAGSPADVFITVDIGRLFLAQQAGIFGPVKSSVLESRIPAHLRDPEGRWFGFSQRARVIVYNKAEVKAGEIRDYEDLADPKWSKRICVRSSAHPYQLSLVASLIANDGAPKTTAWLEGLTRNLARAPKGGDTDQLRAVAAGECTLALSNQYYVVRLMRSTRADDRKAMANLGVVMPNQGNRGTHMNVSGGGMVKTSRNPVAAQRFLEYLASDEAQRYFADGNNEWPAVPSLKIANPELAALGEFKADRLPVADIARNQPLAQKLADRAGYR